MLFWLSLLLQITCEVFVANLFINNLEYRKYKNYADGMTSAKYLNGTDTFILELYFKTLELHKTFIPPSYCSVILSV